MASYSPTVEVCRDFLDNRCKREERCRYAHPSERIEINNGRVICCMDSLKNRCNREDPPCKFYHPPSHIKERLGQDLKANRFDRYQDYQDDDYYATDYQDYDVPYGDRGGNLQSALMNTLLPQLSYLTDHVINRESHGGLDPSITDTLNHCRALLDSAVQSSRGAGYDEPRRNMHRGDSMEVCREFLRGVCNRGDEGCRFAHPTPNIYMNSDKTVTVCLKFLRGDCNLDNCRYFHLPKHLERYFSGGPGVISSYRKRRAISDDCEEGPHLKHFAEEKSDSTGKSDNKDS